MPSEPLPFCQVSNADLFFMVLGYVRYAMGRTSTAGLTAQDMITKYGHALTTDQLTQIAAEIDHDLRMAERMDGFLGARCDHETWKGTAALIHQQLALR